MALRFALPWFRFFDEFFSANRFGLSTKRALDGLFYLPAGFIGNLP
jgi:hypothetical protein